MIIWRYSPTRIFIIDEYWIFIPLSCLGNYVLMKRIRAHKARKQEARRLVEEKLKRQRDTAQFLKVLYLAGGCSILSYVASLRGGEEIPLVDTDYKLEYFDIPKGIVRLETRQYIKRLKEIIGKKFKRKVTGEIIYVTATAFCHLLQHQGPVYTFLPGNLGDVVLTSIAEPTRKAVVSICIGFIPTLYILNPVLVLFPVIGLIGLKFIEPKIVYEVLGENLDASKIKRRILTEPEIIIINLRDRLRMPGFKRPNAECLIPGQPFISLQNQCQSSLQGIPDDMLDLIASPGLNYNDVVNMGDFSGLGDTIQCSDIRDLGVDAIKNGQLRGTPLRNIGFNSDEVIATSTEVVKSFSSRVKSKIVNFLDKFSDPTDIPDENTWDLEENSLVNTWNQIKILD